MAARQAHLAELQQQLATKERVRLSEKAARLLEGSTAKEKAQLEAREIEVHTAHSVSSGSWLFIPV